MSSTGCSEFFETCFGALQRRHLAKRNRKIKDATVIYKLKIVELRAGGRTKGGLERVNDWVFGQGFVRMWL